MNYETWLENINILTNINDKRIIESLKKEEVNPNINHMIEPKLIDLAKNKIGITINKLIRDLDEIFSDTNYLDLALVNFKKEINVIIDIINLKQIRKEEQISLLEKLKNDTDDVYDILIKEANKIDQTGILSITIKNNRIKWKEV